jgi:hypothetical protein
MPAINFVAVLAAGIAGWLVGAVWYGALGKVWMAAAGIECPDGKRPMPIGPMIVAFVAQIIIALMLAGLMGHMGPRDHSPGHRFGGAGLVGLYRHDAGGRQRLSGQEDDADSDRCRPLAGRDGGSGRCVRPLRLSGIETFFDWLEHTGISLWVRGDSLLAFPTILTIHTIGMGFLAGTNWAIACRILGVAPGVPVGVLEKFYPVIWTAFAANAVSGVLLFLGYPYKAATNPVFYAKLTFIAVGIILVLKIRNEVLRPYLTSSGEAVFAHRAKRLAFASIIAWAGAITAGRLLAYTFHWLRVGIPGGF